MFERINQLSTETRIFMFVPLSSFVQLLRRVFTDPNFCHSLGNAFSNFRNHYRGIKQCGISAIYLIDS